MADAAPSPPSMLSAVSQRRPDIELESGHVSDVLAKNTPLDLFVDCNPALGKSRGLSAQFKKLVDQVICVHLQELEDLRPEVLHLRKENKSSHTDREDAATHAVAPSGGSRGGTAEKSKSTAEEEAEETHKEENAPHLPVDIDNEHRGKHGTGTEPASIISRTRPKSRVDTEKLRRALDSLDESSNSDVLLTRLTKVKTEATWGSEAELHTQPTQEFAFTSWYIRLRTFLESQEFEVIISGILLLNVIVMALELQFMGLKTGAAIGFYREGIVDDKLDDSLSLVFSIVDNVFTGIFLIDVSIRIVVLRCKFWKLVMNWIDVMVVSASIVELFQTRLPFNPVMFRLLRIGKLARALRMITTSSALQSLQLLIKCIQASLDMLFWSFCLLTFIQCVAGMIVSHLAQSFMEDPNTDLELRIEVFRYYGTFTRTFLCMFEIFFANWSPPCRVLMENVSESFSIFFLIYRCVLGFAVVNVVNAVFVQQTMKTASSDEELAFRQKQKEIALYTRKVKSLFDSIDDSGDGTLTFDEFAKLVESPKLSFWMGQLQLEYHDLLSLFEFMDNGDGEITLSEFIDGAARLKGPAKAIDVFRIETKLELTLAELLRNQGGRNIQEVFEASRWSHIQPTVGA